MLRLPRRSVFIICRSDLIFHVRKLPRRSVFIRGVFDVHRLRCFDLLSRWFRFLHELLSWEVRRERRNVRRELRRLSKRTLQPR